VTEGFEGWRFDAKAPADRSLMPPRVAPDGPTVSSGTVAAALGGVVALTLLAVCEGTFAWIALRWAAELGWMQAPGWLPLVGIALAVTFLRGIDRAVFTRK
jgi:hypothetical protein